MAIELANPEVVPTNCTRKPGKAAAHTTPGLKRRSARRALINCSGRLGNIVPQQRRNPNRFFAYVRETRKVSRSQKRDSGVLCRSSKSTRRRGTSDDGAR